MTSPTTVHLYFLRLVALLAHGALLIAGTILFAFGMLELFNVLALLALSLIWVVLHPAAAKVTATREYDRYRVGEKVDSTGRLRGDSTRPGCSLERYTSLRGLRARKRARKALSITRERYDITFAVVTTLLWLSYIGFLSSVIASA